MTLVQMEPSALELLSAQASDKQSKVAARHAVGLLTHQSCSGMVQALGIKKEASSCCSELQGAHVMLMAILAMCTLHQVAEGKAAACCDNEMAAWLPGQRALQASTCHKRANLA